MDRADLEHWSSREVARLLSLVEAERRYYQEMMASVPVGVAVLASDLTFLSVNRTFRQTLDLPAGSLGRLGLHDVFPDESVAAAVREVLQTPGSRKSIAAEATIEGRRKPIRLSIQPFRGWGEDAEPEALLAITDLSAGHELAAGNKEQYTSLLGALAASHDAIFWDRLPGKLDFSHVAGRPDAVIGFDADQLLSEPHRFLEQVHPDDRKWLATFYKNAASADSARTCEYRAYRADGELVWLRDLVRAQAASVDDEPALSGVTIDASALRSISERRAEAEKFAALTRLAARIAHDCNNLLMIVSGYGEQVLSGLPEGHTAREDISEIMGATQRLSKVTSELVNFTRRPLLLPKLVDLNKVIQDLKDSLRRMGGDNVEIALDRDPALVRVSADPEALAKSILRLVECSRDAMPAGGRITIRTANAEIPAGIAGPEGALLPGTFATVSVSDTGSELDEESRTRLFEPLYTGPRSGSAMPGVYSVVKDSGGDIAVSSSARSGTTITIYLPSAEPPASVADIEAPSGGAITLVPQPRPMPTVLVVEDEAGIRTLMRKILQKQGYNVLEAGNGEEALQLSAQHSETIDLLLTDVVMPRMGGKELADHLKDERPGIKVLFVSGYSDEDLAQHGPLPREAAFLQKPFSLVALIEKVRNLLSEAD